MLYLIPGNNLFQALVNVGSQQALVPKKAPTMPKPEWHPPWKLYRVSNIVKRSIFIFFLPFCENLFVNPLSSFLPSTNFVVC